MRKKLRQKRETRSAISAAENFLSRIHSEPLSLDQSFFLPMVASFQAIADSGKIDVETSRIHLPESNSLSSRAAKIGSTAVIALEGFIEPKETFWTRYGYGTALSTFIKDVKEANNDSEIESIVIYCDSPGGFSMMNYEAADVVYQAGKNKETIGFGEGMVASACFNIFAACNQKIATSVNENRINRHAFNTKRIFEILRRNRPNK